MEKKLKSNRINPSESQRKTLIEKYRSGQYDEAEKLALSMTQQFPEQQFSWKVLGAILGQTGRKSEALDACQRAVELAPKEAEVQNNLGVAFKELGRIEEAEASYRQAIALKSDYAEAHNNLGNALKDQGRLEECEASYKQAIALKSDFYEAHRNLTKIKKFGKRDEQFVQMQVLYLDKSCSEEQCCHLAFALAKASEDLGDIEQSFKYYCEGNALRKKLLKYDISQDIVIFNQLKTCYSRIKKYSLRSEDLSNEQKPIFIVGMPRSGTTLIEQIISSHSQVTGGGELRFAAEFGDSIARGLFEVNTDALLNFKKKYLKKLETFSNASPLVTDKMPQNFRYIGLLAAAFPDAKIVHVKRNSAAVCWGNYKQFFKFRGLGYCYELDDIVKYYALYRNLMEFWEIHLPNRIYNIDYELLTTNQADETKNLIQHLDLSWENECLSPQNNERSITTASNAQVRLKVYQGSSQQWEKFKPYLNGAFDYLDN